MALEEKSTSIDAVIKLFEKSDEPSFIYKDGKYVHCNESAVQFLGYPNKDALLYARAGSLSPECQPDGQRSIEKMSDLISTAFKEDGARCSWVSLGLGGQHIDVQLNLTPFIADDTQYVHIMWGKSSSHVMKHQMASLQQFISNMGDAHLVLKNGVYIECNQAAADMLGYPDQASVLNLGREYFYPDYQPDGSLSLKKAVQLIDNARKNGSCSSEWTYKRKDGSTFPARLLLTYSLVDGEEYIHLVWRDITSELEAQSDSIKELLSRMGDASLLIKDNQYIDCNQAAADLLGYACKDDLLQIHPIKISPPTQPDGRDSIEKANEIMARGYQESSTYFEWTHLKKDGTPVPVEVLLTPVKINNDEMIHVIWRDITEKKKIEKRVEKLAYEDSLTGLANRGTLVRRLNHVLDIYKRSQQNGALLFIDLDFFKNINDTLGHDIGDKVLKEVGDRLVQTVRAGDTVSRFGGDEFVIMLENLNEDPVEAAKKAEHISEKLLEGLAKPYQIDGRIVSISASIGVSMFDEQSVPTELLKQSDIAMYQAKDSGRNEIRFYDPMMQQMIDQRASTENMIKDALAKDLFSLHYQLQVNEQGVASGVEALLRLQHPEHGVVPPMEYIPVAEETGLILHIGDWVLEQACLQLKRWQSDPVFSKLTMAINVSPMEFNQEAFASLVFDAIERHDIEPQRLKLELTETMMVKDVGDIIEKMMILKAFGVQFSMDDFGTGYSSLQYLRQLPLNQLKIDKSFVQDLEHDEQDRSIVQTIIAMANALELDVIAEGVETVIQQQRLLAFGCNNYQGYLFARPMPVEDVEQQILDGRYDTPSISTSVD